ncbi:ADP-ribosylglycohydrolase family protein [Pelagicoccus mobilis]|uniref:ADP-ribosylglycohydrolase family protein n=1 Tax=Pelagicoccus mobilis TaxID=415221 RepID=A0A934VJD4_9BACT|nr:ADP-ribosylglycohydrolase family protein [Pelagicoccus mobilis]MBK1875496.1 ADP-ribosylglycohydrolase family protein [Pelagicoccus mobilis]
MSKLSKPHTLPYSEYFTTAYDMWLGKFIGGTFGANYEGFKHILDVNVEDLLPLNIVENDDTDLQILWLHALQEHGIDLNSEQMVAEWREHVDAPWSEYGIAIANWERGIMPPKSGDVDNWFFGNGMGCPIRSEIWGIICPGMPGLAASYAKQDAELDHHEDSVQAEIFLAALEAAAFLEKDLMKLIETGLSYIDPESRFAQMVPKVIEWCESNSWQQVRALILRDFGHPDFTNSPQNLGFTILALLKGDGDFVKTMNIAINCAYDTDCTAASAGAILNAISGTAALPPSIRDALTDDYKISDWMLGFPRDGSLKELTHASCSFGLQIASRNPDLLHIPVEQEVPQIPALVVKKQDLAEISPVEKAFPDWVVFGPYSRDWKEVSPQNTEYPDHGCDALPSLRYMTQMHSGFDTDFKDPATLSQTGLTIDATANDPHAHFLPAKDSRLILNGLPDAGSPCSYYAYSEFESPEDSHNWMLAGCTGPIEIWLNGKRILKSDTYQPLNPCTFEADLKLQSGTNRIVLKLEKTSQPVEAVVIFKKHRKRHWHQCFVNTDLNWTPLNEPSEAATL